MTDDVIAVAVVSALTFCVGYLIGYRQGRTR